jgi:hypothetical protein
LVVTCILFVHARCNQRAFDQLQENVYAVRSFLAIQSNHDTTSLIVCNTLSPFIPGYDLRALIVGELIAHKFKKG